MAAPSTSDPQPEVKWVPKWLSKISLSIDACMDDDVSIRDLDHLEERHLRDFEVDNVTQMAEIKSSPKFSICCLKINHK